ncbi:MAG: ABC transporter permease, partial [Pseudomonadota bacterium]
MLILVPFFVAPIIGVGITSIFEGDGFGGILPIVTAANYTDMFGSDLTYRLYFETIKFTVLTWF